MAREFYFVVSDTDTKNPPRIRAEFLSRCAEIEAWIPQPIKRRPNNNMIFTEKIFTLMNDCGILTRETINFLNDKDACNRYFNCKMNPYGGIIRHTSLTMCDKTNLRYYCPLSELKFPSDIETASRKGYGMASCLKIIFEDEVYYISNDWFAPGKSTESN